MGSSLSISSGRNTRRRWIVGGIIFVVVALMSSAASLAYNDRPACGGGYPGMYCNVAMDSVVDNWGMYNRECVSYTAWKVASTGRRMPSGFGDANHWPQAARNAGIAVDSSPRVGDVAIKYEKKFGHSMYIEAVNSDGTLLVSEYNVNGSGGYDQDTVRPDGLVFIHF